MTSYFIRIKYHLPPFTDDPIHDLRRHRQSQTSNAATPVISKQGKSNIRYALYQAAFIAYFTNKPNGRAKEKGIITKMRVKLAAKLLIIAWILMKKKEVFDPACLNMGDTQV
jgi:transposase